MNLAAERVEVHRRPDASGYAAELAIGRDGVLDVVALPGLAVPGRDVLG